MSKPGWEVPWGPLVPDFLPPGKRASEGQGSGSARDSAPRGARPPLHIRRWGLALAAQDAADPSPSLRPSGRPARNSANGRGARSAKVAVPRDRGARAGRGPGREVFTVGSARHRNSSARFGLLHYCFRPQQRRPRRRRQPRARPRPLPPVPSRKGWWGDARGGAVAGKTAHWHGACGLTLTPPAPTLRPSLGFSRDSASLGRISYGSLERDYSYAPLLEASR